MLLTRRTLLPRLEALLVKANSIRAAVAWVNEGRGLEKLLEWASVHPGGLRVIAGISGNASYPRSLEKIIDAADLRIAEPKVLFHPKVYLFDTNEGGFCWVGSANLTRCGFEENDEAVFEFVDDGTVGRWFEDQWGLLVPDSSAIVADYKSRWRPPNARPADRIRPYRWSVSSFPTDWPSYLLALRSADNYWQDKSWWSLFGEFTSWMNTLTLAQSVLVPSSWATIDKEQYRLAMGIERRDGYGLLGSMRGAGRAKNLFNSNDGGSRSVRTRLRRKLQRAIEASDDVFADAAGEFVAYASEIPGVSGAVATRLLALARPDRAISVNSASRARLAQLTKLPVTALNRPKNYTKLLRWFESIEWYSNPSPAADERRIASFRAALVDALVYSPKVRG